MKYKAKVREGGLREEWEGVNGGGFGWREGEREREEKERDGMKEEKGRKEGI